MEKRIIGSFIFLIFIFSFFSSIAMAQEGDDILISGIELDKILALINAWIALFLFIISFIAYRRDERKRFFYVSLAFLLFAIKSFLISSELFIPDIGWIDPAATVLEFGTLLSFFYGVLRK